MNPLDFDAFVMLLGYKTIELDPEDVLIEALSKWDVGHTGLISEDKLNDFEYLCSRMFYRKMFFSLSPFKNTT